MQIKIEFIDEYTSKIDKLLNHSNNLRSYSAYSAFNFCVCLFIFSKSIFSRTIIR